MQPSEVPTLPKFVLISDFRALDETAATATIELDERFPLCQVTYHRGEYGKLGKVVSVDFSTDSFEEDRTRNRIVGTRLKTALPEILHQLLLTELMMLEEEDYFAEEGYVHADKPSQSALEVAI